MRIRIEKIEILTAHPLYLAIGIDAASRQAAYRTLFRQPLDAEALGDIRLAVRQNQPLGNAPGSWIRSSA